jgi:hypothetical protein
MNKARIISIENFFSLPFQLYNPVWTDIYRWDLEQKNQLDGPMDIALYTK